MMLTRGNFSLLLLIIKVTYLVLFFLIKPSFFPVSCEHGKTIHIQESL